jgi:hypothetical protein
MEPIKEIYDNEMFWEEILFIFFNLTCEKLVGLPFQKLLVN